MNTLQLANASRKAHKTIIKAMTPFLGKNLNRSKKGMQVLNTTIQGINELNIPFEMTGITAPFLHDIQCVNLDKLNDKVGELEALIFDLDLFDSYKVEYEARQQAIAVMGAKQREIQARFKSISTWRFSELIKEK